MGDLMRHAQPVEATQAPAQSHKSRLSAQVLALGRLESSVIALDQARRAQADYVWAARAAGCTWTAIGDALGLDRETARRRFTPS